MTGRSAPKTMSPTHADIVREARRQGLSGYALRKTTGLGLTTLQRFFAGEGSPTLATVEAIAKALGMVVKAEGGVPVVAKGRKRG